MTTLAALRRAVQATIDSKRIGTPVFVRLTLQGSEKDEALTSKLAIVAGLAVDWIGGAPDRLYAIGTSASGQVALTLQFPSGTSALVSFAHGPPRGDGVDMMVLGNHGAIYHDAGSAELWDEPAEAAGLTADPKLRARIAEALRAGKPVDMTPEGRP